MLEDEKDFGWSINRANGRACVQAPFGIACYQGRVKNGKYDGVHQGVVGTPEDADRWLRGEQPLGLIEIYDEQTRRAQWLHLTDPDPN